MKNFTHSQSADNLTVVQQIYNLPELEFKRLYRQSAALNALGIFYFFTTCLWALGALSIWITLGSTTAMLICGLFIIYPYSLSNLYKKQRNKSAGKAIKIISFTTCLFSVLTAIGCGVSAFSDPKSIVFSLASLIVFFIFYTIFRATKNPLLFNDGTPSHKQIKYISECREKGIFNPCDLPQAREPKKLDAFFRICALIITILWFILPVLAIPVGFIKGIMENTPTNPQEYVQKADQAMEKKNFGDAFKLYEKAAKQNLPEGIFNLGICYAEGIGCDEDFAKAYECFNHPDVKDAPLAKFYIGIMHYSGQGAPQDFQKAAELLKSAADSGVEAAQKFLGYQNGKMPDYNVPLAKLLEENFKQNEKN